jgi:hypothetical protein
VFGVAVLAVLAAASSAACGSDGSGEEPVADTVATTRLRSQNDAACEHLAEVREVDRETARLSAAVAGAIPGGDDAAVLAAAEALAAHVESSAPAVAAAYADAAAVAPESAAAAIEALAASAADTGPRLAALMRSATSTQDLARLYAALGAAEVPETPESDDELRNTISRYTDVICGFSMSG